MALVIHNRTVAFTHPVQMRFSDTDMLGHVNNARFLTYLEDARIAYLTELGSQADNGFMPGGLIVARVEIDYVKPLVPSSAPVAVESWISHIGGKSFTVGSRIDQGGQAVARALAVLVAYDYGGGRSRPLSDPERAVLETQLEVRS